MVFRDFISALMAMGTIAISLTGCVFKTTQWDNLSNETGISVSEVKILREVTGITPKQMVRKEYKYYDSVGKVTIEKTIFLPAITSNVKDNQSIEDQLLSIQSRIGMGYMAFICDAGTGANGIAIMKTKGKFDPLVLMGTNGMNYDINTEQLVAKLTVLDQRLDLTLIGADFDWCEFSIRDEPEDWMSLAEEIYKFCPDIVDQGTQTVQALSEELKHTKKLYLWFD